MTLSGWNRPDRWVPDTCLYESSRRRSRGIRPNSTSVKTLPVTSNLPRMSGEKGANRSGQNQSRLASSNSSNTGTTTGSGWSEPAKVEYRWNMYRLPCRESLFRRDSCAMLDRNCTESLAASSEKSSLRPIESSVRPVKAATTATHACVMTHTSNAERDGNRAKHAAKFG